MGNMTNAEKRLLTVPFFSKGTVGEKLAGRFQKLQQTILNRKENDPHALNPKNVTGIWYLSGLQYEEGNPQVLVRSDIPKGTYERILLHNEIFEIIYNDVVYDYDKDFVEGENVIHGLQKELLGELRAGRVYAIYDKERS